MTLPGVGIVISQIIYDLREGSRGSIRLCLGAHERPVPPELRQQHRDGEERKGLDAVLMGAERARGDRVFIEARVARPGIVETAEPDPLDRRDRQQLEHQRSENAPFGDRHGSPPTRRGDARFGPGKT